MLKKTIKNWNSMTDAAIIADMGLFIKTERLKQGKTQADVADFAGINRYTVKQIETGRGISLISLISILRALDLFYVLNSFEVVHEISPMMIAKQDKKKRQRARSIPYKIDDSEASTFNDLAW